MPLLWLVGECMTWPLPMLPFLLTLHTSCPFALFASQFLEHTEIFASETLLLFFYPKWAFFPFFACLATTHPSIFSLMHSLSQRGLPRHWSKETPLLLFSGYFCFPWHGHVCARRLTNWYLVLFCWCFCNLPLLLKYYLHEVKFQVYHNWCCIPENNAIPKI